MKGIGWPKDIPEFDSVYDIQTYGICQLIPGTADGFPEIASEVHREIGPDLPLEDCIDLPHWDDILDPPHWED